MRLLQEEIFRLELISSYSEEELQSFLTQCGIPWEASDTKVMACLPTYKPAGGELFTVFPSFTLAILANFSSDCTKGKNGLELSACRL